MADDRTTVLVADDESSLRDICYETLTEAGYKVIKARDGLHALEYLHQQQVDLVLSDMRMPNMNGIQLLERIQQEELDVDFLVMTGFGTIETAVDIMQKGALDYLPKPFDISHLMLKVEKALEQRRQRKERKNLNNMVRVLKLSNDLSNQLELTTLLNEFVFHLQQNFRPGSVGVFLREHDQDQFDLMQTAGSLFDHSDQPGVEARNMVEAVSRARTAKIVGNNLLSQNQAGERPLACMGAPLFVRDQLIGVVVLLRKVAEPRFTNDDLQLLSVFSSQTASAIENARLYGQMREMNNDVIRSFARAVEAKDLYTRGHSEQVGHYATVLGRKLGLSIDELNELALAGIVHDIGKIGVPDHILNKPDRLTPQEYAVMKRHPEVGHNILSQVNSLRSILPIIYHHHERVDGLGYPSGLTHEEIPFLARLISVVDAFEAMTSDRAYRKALSLDTVKEIMYQGAGSQWDGHLVQIWLQMLDKDEVPLP